MDYKVLEIEFNDKNVIITLDSGEVKKLDLESFLLNPLVKDQLVNDKTLKEIDNKILENEAYKYCIKLLAKQAYSSFGLISKLEPKYSKKIIDNVIRRLTNSHLLNDEQYVISFFENKLAKAWSINRIVFELENMGFNNIKEEMINSFKDEEYKSCLKFSKLYKTNHLKLSDDKLKAKLYQQLKLKGFDDEIINNVFKDLNLSIFIDY